MTLTNIILCLIAGISLAYAQKWHSEVSKLLEDRHKLAMKNFELKIENQMLNEEISEAIKEADENETW